jgi:hypothetical protein
MTDDKANIRENENNNIDASSWARSSSSSDENGDDDQIGSKMEIYGTPSSQTSGRYPNGLASIPTSRPADNTDFSIGTGRCEKMVGNA